MLDVKALTFDTGGTLLDWHAGIAAALKKIGDERHVQRDWPVLTNEYRRSALKMMAGQEAPDFNMDDVHAKALDGLLSDHGIQEFTADDRASIVATWHRLETWPDFPPAMKRLQTRFKLVSFTILSVGIVMDVSRKNGLFWDLALSCELIGTYKPQPASYQKAAKLMQLAPSEILMVACHNYDLDAARAQGYRTAFVRRPQEWGIIPPPDPDPNPAVDIVVDHFNELAERLLVS